MKKLTKFKKRIFIVSLFCIFALCLLSFTQPAAISVFSSFSQGERKLPIYCVLIHLKRKYPSALMPHGVQMILTQLLQILADNDVKATFFMCGYWVDKYPEEVKKIAEAGHDLGNHSATHPHMNSLSSEQIKTELEETHQKVLDLTGVSMNLFRPPFGEYNNTVIQTANDCGYYPIRWDVEANATE